MGGIVSLYVCATPSFRLRKGGGEGSKGSHPLFCGCAAVFPLLHQPVKESVHLIKIEELKCNTTGFYICFFFKVIEQQTERALVRCNCMRAGIDSLGQIFREKAAQ